MPKVPKGQMSLDEIRSLVRQHNKLSTIKGVDTKSRAQLLKDIDTQGYRVDHASKKIQKLFDVKTIGVGEGKGSRKPQVKTVAKARRKEFAKEATKGIDKKTGKTRTENTAFVEKILMKKYGGHSVIYLAEHLKKIGGSGGTLGRGSKANILLKIRENKGLSSLPEKKSTKPSLPKRPIAMAKEKERKEKIAKGRADLIYGSK